MELRPYQRIAIERLRDSLAAGNLRPVLQLPTGAGKTRIAAEIISRLHEKGRRAIFCVPRKSLVDQTIERFWANGIRAIGAIQADHPMTNFERPIQIASVQTLMRRPIPHASLVIVDEAHLCFDFVHKWMKKEEWRDVPFIGLSATPWARGMGKHWSNLIVGATIETLTRDGHLAPMRYMAPDLPDLSGVRVVAGDYHKEQLSASMRRKTILARGVEKWAELGEGRPTIVFCVDRAHAQSVQQQFVEAHIPCGYIDAHTQSDERKSIADRLRDGRISAVASVGCLIEGVDWPWVSCVLHLRPTKSHILHIQSIGRGLRLWAGKQDCLVLDCAGNYRLGHPYDVSFDALDDGRPRSTAGRNRREDAIREAKACTKCGAMRPNGSRICPNCGHKHQKQSQVAELDNELVEIGRGGRKKKKRSGKDPKNYTRRERQLWYSSLVWIMHDRGYKKGWANVNYREKFGRWPGDDDMHAEPVDGPSPEVLLWVRGRMIRYAKSRARKERKFAE